MWHLQVVGEEIATWTGKLNPLGFSCPNCEVMGHTAKASAIDAEFLGSRLLLGSLIRPGRTFTMETPNSLLSELTITHHLSCLDSLVPGLGTVILEHRITPVDHVYLCL